MGAWCTDLISVISGEAPFSKPGLDLDDEYSYFLVLLPSISPKNKTKERKRLGIVPK